MLIFLFFFLNITSFSLSFFKIWGGRVPGVCPLDHPSRGCFSDSNLPVIKQLSQRSRGTCPSSLKYVVIVLNTVCPTSNDPIYIVGYNIKWVTTSGTDGRTYTLENLFSLSLYLFISLCIEISYLFLSCIFLI